MGSRGGDERDGGGGGLAALRSDCLNLPQPRTQASAAATLVPPGATAGDGLGEEGEVKRAGEKRKRRGKEDEVTTKYDKKKK